MRHLLGQPFLKMIDLLSPHRQSPPFLLTPIYSPSSCSFSETKRPYPSELQHHTKANLLPRSGFLLYLRLIQNRSMRKKFRVPFKTLDKI